MKIKTLVAVGMVLLHSAHAESGLGDILFSFTNASSVVVLPEFQEFNSNLPLVILNTLGNTVTNFQKAPAWVTFIGATNGRSSNTGPIEYDGHAGVSFRGNASQSYPKRPYRIELQDEMGNDFKAPLFGMPKESDWILYPSYTDKTMVRDVLAYELWRQMGYYAPRTRYVELFIVSNAVDRPPHPALSPAGGEGKLLRESSDRRESALAATRNPQLSTLNSNNYEGVYVLVEKIKRGKNRVNIQKSKPDSADSSWDWLSGGYIFKKDRLSPWEKGFGSAIGMQFTFEDPKERDIRSEQNAWLTGFVRAIEHVLLGTNFLDPQIGYTRYFDVDSFIDYHWITEVGKNIDGYWFSQFYHMDRGGKLKMGPIWDWDLSFGNAFYHEGYQTNGWRWEKIRGPHYKWFARMFEDPDFLQRYIDRWAELRSTVFSTSNMLAQVDKFVAQVQEAQVRNYARWTNLGVYVHPNRFIGKTYQEEVDWLKQWIVGRLAWIDSQDFTKPVTQLVRTPPASAPKVAMAWLVGKVYYTTDGSDPRSRGGAVSPAAKQYTEPILLDMNTVIIARVRSDYGLWSAPIKVNGASLVE